MAEKSFVVRPEDLPIYSPPAHIGTVNRRLIGIDTVGAQNFELILGNIAPEGEAQPHYHEQSEQSFYLLEGRCEVEVDGEVVEMKPGEAAFFAAGRKHRITPIGGPMKVLVIYAPPLEAQADAFRT